MQALGVVPLITSSGAGAAARYSMGLVIFAGIAGLIATRLLPETLRQRATDPFSLTKMLALYPRRVNPGWALWGSVRVFKS